jgi:hypothetical protein
MALAVVFLVWHLGIYWALHPEVTWLQVLQIKRRRALGGLGLLMWGAAPWLVPRRKKRKQRTPRVRHRGRDLR